MHAHGGDSNDVYVQFLVACQITQHRVAEKIPRLFLPSSAQPVGDAETACRSHASRGTRPDLSHNRWMVTLDGLRTERRKEILRLAEQHGAHSLRVFGSVARGDANENSDLDLLVA